IAAWNLLYAIAPVHDRSLYIGLSNTVLALPSLAPVAAGILIPFLGTPALLGLAALMAAITVSFSFRFGALRAADARALSAATSGAEAEA
ncbi:MAG TPA: hypothetical protein PKN52_07490, partial [Trueperaceae bacterium]|nr:hypothetical protein [Trueperaceae bacterium]